MASSETKKQIPLRLSDNLYREIAAWADEDFRSVNGQIEFLLSECVKKRKKQKVPLADGGVQS
ncbi:MAG: PTS ascorbate transporter subunit IIC [Coriobacteriia bacterium]|nr:PTS ascorbate transporter subunit IIC [Coriobacteriia bacterium]